MSETNVAPASPPFPGDGAWKAQLDAMIRVDHAGEYGAVQIYRGQRAVFDRIKGKSRTAAILADMEAGEAHHLETFDRLIRERGVRPTALAPFWRIAGYSLGAATALMGEKAAHACTAAVEEVIEQHYAAQAMALRDRDPELAGLVTQFGAEESEHKHAALAAGAAQAPGYGLLSAVIKAGCRLAIAASERV